MRVLLVKTGTTVPHVRERRGDFEAWFAAGMDLPQSAMEVLAVYQGTQLPESYKVDAIVVTGSASMITDHAPWSEATAAWLRGVIAGGTPLLGVCYGHQLIAHAMGGEIGDNPNGRQIGTIDVTLTQAGMGDPLFRHFPETLHVPASHVQSVLKLPPDARILGTSARDPHHAFAIGDRVWAVQFHPEFDAEIVRGYVEARWDVIAEEGLDPRALFDSAIDTADGARLLRRFAHMVRAGL